MSILWEVPRRMAMMTVAFVLIKYQLARLIANDSSRCIIVHYYTDVAQLFECNTRGPRGAATRIISARIARKNLQYLFYLTICACYIMNMKKYHQPAHHNR